MGQKTHPIGLRVGLSQKWSSSWYDNKGFFANKNQNFLSKGIIGIRGGVYFNGIEEFIIKLLNRKLVTKFNNTFKYIPVDFRFFKGYGGHTYGFLVYTKLITQR